MSDLPETPSFRLDGRRALVTGAGRGLGLAISAALAGAGASVVMVARGEPELQAGAQAVCESGGRAEAVPADVTDRPAFAGLVDAHGPFDVFVNNAGTNRPAPFLDVTEADFDAVAGLNLKAAFFCAQAVARSMAGSGRKGSIINMSSQMGHVGASGRAAYCASKHAVEGFTKVMALELGPLGIRVNTLCPTFIETQMTRPFLADEAFRAAVMDKIALGRLGTPADITGAVLFLACDASALMTGSALVLDGGWTAA